jgi:hypothetical protein
MEEPAAAKASKVATAKNRQPIRCRAVVYPTWRPMSL